MEATIVSFRRGRKTQTMNQMILKADSANSKEDAEKLVGKSVKWQSPSKDKKVLSGKISAAHGGKGAVRAIFETGMPGQSLGTKADIE
ncbi:50S ribosomal protein L35ae [Candidatus Woesearchaeota archaeon]|nr:50S ribosomal protein L35ae [Candidatus Woesearchaeota archaeon]